MRRIGYAVNSFQYNYQHHTRDTWVARGGDRILVKHLSNRHLYFIVRHLRKFHTESPKAETLEAWLSRNVPPWDALAAEVKTRGLIT